MKEKIQLSRLADRALARQPTIEQRDRRRERAWLTPRFQIEPDSIIEYRGAFEGPVLSTNKERLSGSTVARCEIQRRALIGR